MENIVWEYPDEKSLARVSSLEIGSKRVSAPFLATTVRDDSIYEAVAGKNRRQPSINVAAELLTKTTLDKVGESIETADGLASRLRLKKSGRKDDINVIYSRIPKQYEVKNGDKKQYHSIPKIDDLQISSLADVQLQCDGDLIIPPVPSAITNYPLFKKILARTRNEMQTFSGDKPMMGYIPNIDDRGLVIQMVEEYLKKDYDCRIFGVDFSGAANAPSLMMAIISTLRKKLKIRKNRENNEPYYLHVFNASVSKKSTREVAPVSDLLTHLYGVDSTSGVIWGGGGGKPENSRYITTGDYGAYRKNVAHTTSCNCPVCSKYSIDEIYDKTQYINRLKVHRISSYRTEYNEISEKIRTDGKAYAPYVENKATSKKDAEKIMADVREIKARTGA